MKIKIKEYLMELKYNNVFSGVKEKSYIDNGVYYLNCNYLVSLDIKNFFPNICRDKIYKFFLNNMNESPDVAHILTNICTIDYSEYFIDKDVKKYFKENNLKRMKHLPTGSPSSCILSYLVNLDMFQEIEKYIRENNCKVSFYVDDIVILSTFKINKNIIEKVESIIRTHGYKIQKKKLKNIM